MSGRVYFPREFRRGAPPNDDDDDDDNDDDDDDDDDDDNDDAAAAMRPGMTNISSQSSIIPRSALGGSLQCSPPLRAGKPSSASPQNPDSGFFVIKVRFSFEASSNFIGFPSRFTSRF